MRKSIAFVVVVVALLAPREGWAQTTVVDLVLSDETVEEIVFRILDHNPVEPRSMDCANASETCWLDHVDYDLSGAELYTPTLTETEMAPGQKVDIPDVFVKVPGTFHWKTASCVSDPGCPLTTFDEVQHAAVHIRIFVDKGDLCGSLAGIGFLGVGLPNPVPPPQCTSLKVKFSGLSEDYKSVFRGITVDSSTEHLVLREEYQLKSQSPTFNQVFWQKFFDGGISTPLSSDVSVFIGRKMIIDGISDRFRKGVIGSSDVYYDGPTEEVWTPSGAQVTLTMTQPVKVDTVDAADSPCVLGRVPADIDAVVTLSLDSTNDFIVTDIKASIDVDENYASLCLPSPGTSGSIVAAIIAAVVDTLDFSSYVPSTNLPNCKTVAKLHYQCPVPLGAKTLNLPSTLGSGNPSLDFVSMLTDGEGIHLGIDATFPPVLADTVSVFVVDPTFGVHGHCSNYRIGYEGALHVYGFTRIFGVDLDPATTDGWTQGGTGFPTVAPAALWLGADPEQHSMTDLKVTVKTSSGLQSFWVQAPAPASPTEKWHAELELVGNTLVPCLRWEEELIISYDPRWDIDPPHRGIVEIRTPNEETLYGYAMLVELDLDIQDGAWLAGTLLVDVGNRDLDAIPFRVQAMGADEVRELGESEIAERLHRRGFARQIELPPELMRVPDAVALFQLGVPYEGELDVLGDGRER